MDDLGARFAAKLITFAEGHDKVPRLQNVSR
jgi:hypothetical protein